MTLQPQSISAAAFNDDDAGGNNYFAGKAIYVHKTNGSYASIYSDSGGVNLIAQNGINNVTNDKGVFTFYIDGGEYYAQSDGERVGFWVTNAELIESYAVRAEDAAAQASSNAKIFETVALGEAGTVDGDYFSVISASNDGYLDLYLNNLGVAELEKTYPSIEAIASFEENIMSLDVTGAITDNEFINATTGATQPSTDYKRTDYIAINENQGFIFVGETILAAGIAFYDENKVFISGFAAVKSEGFLTPQNCRYLRACTRKDLNTDLNIYFKKVSAIEIYIDNESQLNQLTILKGSVVDLITNQTLTNGLINADGTVSSNASYEVTDFIPLNKNSEILYTGRVIAPTVAVAFYDENKAFISATSISGNLIDRAFNTEQARYIRACSSTASPEAFSLKCINNSDNSINEQFYPNLIDVLADQTIETGYINSTGDIVFNSAYRTTGFIEISGPGSTFLYTGRALAPAFNAAIYDKDFNLLDASLQTPNTVDYAFKITDENAKYVKFCSSTSSAEPFAIKAYQKDLAEKSNIRVVPISSTRFNVEQLTESGEVLTHTFQKRESTEYTEDGWYSSWVSHNGVNIAQGNFNFIHNVDKVGENKFVGIGHGCETFKWVRFFVDGEQFEPGVTTKALKGDRFHFQFLSDIYAADDSIEAGEFTAAKEPLELSTQHYMDCEIKREGVKRYNKLIMARDTMTFNQLSGAMQQTNQPPMDGNLLYNANIPFRIHFPTSNDTPEPLAPDTTAIGSNSPIANVNKVTATGNDGTYSYTVETAIRNGDNAKNGDLAVRSWTSRNESNKMYFFPEVTTYSAAVLGKPATVFNTGDVIECYSYTKYGVSKL